MSTALIIYIVAITVTILTTFGIMLSTKFYSMKKIYIYNADSLEVIGKMPFPIKLKRLEAMSTDKNSEHYKQFSYLSIDLGELRKHLSKISITNDKYFELVKSLKFKSAKRLYGTIKSEIRDLTLEALTLTSKLDELTYTSTITELVMQQLTVAFNNLKMNYMERPSKESRDPNVEKKVKKLIFEIEELYKEANLNVNTRQHDKNLEVLTKLAKKIEIFGLTATRYSRISEILVSLVEPKLRKINENIERYSYLFETQMDTVNKFNNSIESMVNEVEILLTEDDYALLFETTKKLIERLFDFNFWSKFQKSASETVRKYRSKVDINMDNIAKFHKISVKRIKSTEYASEEEKVGFEMELQKRYNDLKMEHANLASTMHEAIPTIDIVSQYNYLSKFFEMKREYYNYIDLVENKINGNIKPMLTFFELSKSINLEMKALNWFKTTNNITLDNISQQIYDTTFNKINDQIKKANEGTINYKSSKIELLLEELQSDLKRLRDFLILDGYIKGISDSIITNLARNGNENDAAANAVREYERFAENGEYFLGIESLLKLTKI